MDWLPLSLSILALLWSLYALWLSCRAQRRLSALHEYLCEDCGATVLRRFPASLNPVVCEACQEARSLLPGDLWG